MKKTILTLFIPLAFSLPMAIAQNAPITTAGTVVTYGTTAVVPLTVTDFTSISLCDLKLTYDASIATVTAVTKNPIVGAWQFIPEFSIPGEITIGWFSAGPVTLLPNSVFATITFDKVTDGYSAIEFENSQPANNQWGTYPPAVALNDTPKSDYYLDGSVTFASGGTQWTGSTDDDWSDDANWTANVPGATSIAIINDVSPNLFPLASTNAECLGLDIGLEASVTVPVNSTLTVYGNLINNGQLTVESSAAGDGSFINYGANTGTGLAKVGRYVVSEEWHYVSPPISNGLSGIFLDLYLTKWDEPSGIWSNIVPVNIGLNPMQGYGTWADNDLTGTTTVYYEGSIENLNTGNYSSGTLTSVGPNDPVLGTRGFNFVGNPYPSAVDWDEGTGWTKTGLANAIYIWNPNVGSYGSYINSNSTNGVTNIIPTGQGFYVHVPVDNSTGSLTVNNNARLHDPTPFFKNTESEQQWIRLAISSDINMYSDEVIISFNENATANFDPSSDAFNLKGLVEAPDLYSISSDDKYLSINANPELDENVIIPVGCTIGTDGYYIIKAMEVLNFYEPTKVFLEDKLKNIFIDLTNHNSYSFFGSTTDASDRFNLHFLVNPSNAIEHTEKMEIQIYAVEQTLYLKHQDSGILDGTLKGYDILGRQVFAETVAGTNQFETRIGFEGILLVSYYDNSEQKEYRQKVRLK